MSNKVFIAGHNGMVGSAIQAVLQNNDSCEIITKKRSELDLRRQEDVENFLAKEKPNCVFICAAKVGGIKANHSLPADFIYDNLMIQNNLIHACFINDVKRLLFLGSSCIYPKYCEQPIAEESLLSGYLEPTNEPYAIAKIAGLKLCDSYNRQFGESHGIEYRTVMPTNLYGPGDNFFSEENSHVIPGLLRRFHKAKTELSESVTVWGTGTATREFLHVNDLADACIKIMDLPKEDLLNADGSTKSHINIGSGEEIAISDLAFLIKEIVGYSGEVKFDKSMPDGTPRKTLNTSFLEKIGWAPSIKLAEGLKSTYEHMKKLDTVNVKIKY